MKNCSFFLIVLLVCCCLNAQNDQQITQEKKGTEIFLANGKEVQRCGIDEVFQYLKENDPNFEEELAKNKATRPNLNDAKKIPCDGSNTIDVPVAFHFDNSFSCANSACILSEINDALTTLNADFGNNTGSPNAANCPAAYPDISTGTCITFYLAAPPACSGLDVACEGSITIGQFAGGYNANGSGAGNCWDDYLNIFVQSAQSGNLGVSDQIPGYLNASGPGEGVSLGGPYFGGEGGPCAPFDTDGTYNLGKTLAHEIGHYLGLPHIWGDVNGGGCGGDDGFADTPNQASQYFGCPNGCVNSGCGGSQQTANFMNYTDDACMDLFTEDQAATMNFYANQFFGGLNIPAASPTELYSCTGNPCVVNCPTQVNVPYSNTENFCSASGSYDLGAIDLSGVTSDEPGTFVWSTGGYLSAGGTAISGTTYTPTAVTSCAPQDQLIYLNLTCDSDANVEIDAGILTLVVYADPGIFTVTDLVNFTDGACNGPTFTITPGCEAYVTVAQNGGPTFPVTSGSGAVNYDVTLNFPTECCEQAGGPLTIVGTTGNVTLNDASATQNCVNGTQPAIWEIQFTIPTGQNATTVAGSGIGSITEVCIDLTVNNSDVLNITLDSPDCNGYEWEELWLGTAFNGGSNTGSTNICFTPGTANGQFDGTFDGDDGTNGSFLGCGINSNTWIIYIADYNCYLNGATGGTLNGATITFDDGTEAAVAGACDYTATANYNCTTVEHCDNICYSEYNANPANGSVANATLCVTPLGCADGPDASCLTTQACNDNDVCTINDEETIVTLTNEVCVTCAGTVDQTSCNPACTTMQACNDGNPCTTNDMETVSADGSICIPCAGTIDPTSCDAACVTVQACDDGNPCTINDEETVSADGGVCVPCAGVVDPTSCDAACVTVQACDDGNPCTINDEETVSADGGVCVPCAGIVDPTSCDAACVTVQACDDGNPCTINDEETVSADGGVCVPCAGIVDPTSCDAACVTVQACDDGNPCTINDEETVSADGGVCVPCAGIVDPTSCDAACVTVQACDDGNPCTINDEETVSADGGVCVPCAGIVDPTSCDAACVTVQACDDGNPCTINDEETVSADGGVCVPCAGIVDPTSCDAACVTVQACDDGNPCTINDEETVSVNGGICVPCAGIVDPTSCDAGCTTMQACDDGDPCTSGEMETLAANGDICVPCGGGVPVTPACGDPNATNYDMNATCIDNNLCTYGEYCDQVCFAEYTANPGPGDIANPTLCVTPVSCTGDASCFTTTGCDDGNPCTINDEETTAPDGSICVPCAGVVDPTSCDANCTTMQGCDDGDPCTINDMETVSADGGICIPCAGVVDSTSCDAACSTIQGCDDGNPCTINDEETVAADGSICVPCAGVVDPTSCDGACTTVQACDDGNPCTINDMETVSADGGICVPCAGIVDATSCDAGCTTMQACDDGDPCTSGEMETLAANGDICVPCGGGVPVTPACGDPNATNYDMNATCIDNNLCTYGEYCDLICFAEYTDSPNPGDIANSTLCVTPVSCNGDASCLVTQACDDGNPCTINDEETVAPDGSVCVPCAGIVDATSCDAACVTTQACDDGDPCTTGETESISADGSICVACGGGAPVTPACGDPNATNYDMNATCIDNNLCTYGEYCDLICFAEYTANPAPGDIANSTLCVTPVSCNGDASCLVTQACDDGNPCTINDEETVAPDGSVCVPCAGIVDATSCDAACVTTQACDDGDPCTIGETEGISADGSICVACGGGAPVPPACGDPAANNFDAAATCIDNALCTYDNPTLNPNLQDGDPCSCGDPLNNDTDEDENGVLVDTNADGVTGLFHEVVTIQANSFNSITGVTLVSETGMLDFLGNPVPALPAINTAGTNGVVVTVTGAAPTFTITIEFYHTASVGYSNTQFAIAGTDTADGAITLNSSVFENTCEPCPFSADIPTLSEWGLITLALMLMTYGSIAMAGLGSLAGTNNVSTPIGLQLPVNAAILRKAFVLTAVLALLGYTMSIVFFGAIFFSDIIGVAIAGSVFAYLIHILYLIEQNK